MQIVNLAGGMKVIKDPKGAITEASIYELEKYVRKRFDEKWVPLFLQKRAESEGKKVYLKLWFALQFVWL